MIRLHKTTKWIYKLQQIRVERNTRVSRWGILSIINEKKGHFQIEDVCRETSAPKEAPSNFTVIEMSCCRRKFFRKIKKLKPESRD